VGISVVNALSRSIIAKSRRRWHLGDGVQPWQDRLEDGAGRQSKVTGTTITFWPDELFFETTVYD
jgi:DNA gyrase subunit B